MEKVPRQDYKKETNWKESTMTVQVLVEKRDAGSGRNAYIDAQALIQGFLAKLPDPRLLEPKLAHQISPQDKLFREVAEGLVTNASGVGYVRAEVELDNLENPALAIFLVGRSPSDQNEGSIFVFQKLEGAWTNKTPSEHKLGHKHCLKVRCCDELNTTLLIHRSDPVWESFVLYPESDLCKAWLKLKLLLFPQDGAAITSLLRSKEGPVCGHTTRIVRSIESIVALLENQLVEWTLEEVRRAAS